MPDTFRAADLTDDDLGKYLRSREGDGVLHAFHRTRDGLVQAIIQLPGAPSQIVNLPPGLPVDLTPLH